MENSENIENKKEMIKILTTQIKEIESILADLEKISTRIYNCPISEDDKDIFSKLKSSIYYKRDELGFKRKDLYKQLNREHRRKMRKKDKKDKEFIKELLKKKD